MLFQRYRRAVFIVVYHIRRGKIPEYLILKRKKHWVGWEFPKGGIERFESKAKAAIREVFEETGLETIKIKKFRKKGKYFYSKEFKDRPGIIGQRFRLFSAEVHKGRVKIDKREHSGYKWVNYKKARENLTHQNQKECLDLVDFWIKN